jgi:aspartate racemase
MKKLGLVGGIGPESTLDYYQGIVAGYRRRVSGDEYPRMIIDSLDLTEMYNLAAAKDWETFTRRLRQSIECLVGGGAEFAAMAANTAHIVFDQVSSQSPIPVISMIEETCRQARRNHCHSVVVFGTAFTMSSGLYTAAFARHGIDAFVPTAEDQAAIHNIIFPHLQEGIVLPEEKQQMLEIARKLISEKNADALVLGCTELPLIIKEGDLDVLLLDTAQIHIEAILDYMLS